MAQKHEYRLAGTRKTIMIDKKIDAEIESIAKKTGADPSTPPEKGFQPPEWYLEHREAQSWQYLGEREVPDPKPAKSEK
jgi:hypothetical protein